MRSISFKFLIHKPLKGFLLLTSILIVSSCIPQNNIKLKGFPGKKNIDVTAPVAPAISFNSPVSSPAADSTPTFDITLTGGENFNSTDVVNLYDAVACGGSIVGTTTGVSTATATVTASAQSADTSVVYSAEVVDAAGNSTCSATHATFGSQTTTYFYDASIPTWSNSITNAATLRSLTDSPDISFTANAADAVSGIDKYQYSLGTTSGGSDLISWTDIAGGSSPTLPLQLTGLSLTNANTYYINILAVDGSGLQSIVYTSSWQALNPDAISASEVDTDSQVQAAGIVKVLDVSTFGAATFPNVGFNAGVCTIDSITGDVTAASCNCDGNSCTVSYDTAYSSGAGVINYTVADGSGFYSDTGIVTLDVLEGRLVASDSDTDTQLQGVGIVKALDVSVLGSAIFPNVGFNSGSCAIDSFNGDVTGASCTCDGNSCAMTYDTTYSVGTGGISYTVVDDTGAFSDTGTLTLSVVPGLIIASDSDVDMQGEGFGIVKVLDVSVQGSAIYPIVGFNFGSCVVDSLSGDVTGATCSCNGASCTMTYDTTISTGSGVVNYTVTDDTGSFTDTGVLTLEIVHIFTGSFQNSTTVNGSAIFYDTSTNIGTVSGNAFFYDNSANYYGGVVNGNATFYGNTYDYGTSIGGDVNFCGSSIYYGAPISGIIRFYETANHPYGAPGSAQFYPGTPCP
jgi:hypothetical protein